MHTEGMSHPEDMVTPRIPDLELAGGLYPKIDKERQCTMAQTIDQDTGQGRMKRH